MGWNTDNAWGSKGGWNNSQQPEEANDGFDGSPLDWGDSITFTGATYILLKPGVYDFTVKSFERGYYNGNEKMQGCPTAKVDFEVEADEGTTTVKHTFFLRKSSFALDFIYNFFVAIGQIPPEYRDEKKSFVPDWPKAIGCKGKFEIKSVGKKDDPKIQYNNIKRFIDPPKG